MAPDGHTLDADERAIARLKEVRDELREEKADRLAGGRKVWLAIFLSCAAGLGTAGGQYADDRRDEMNATARRAADRRAGVERARQNCEGGNVVITRAVTESNRRTTTLLGLLLTPPEGVPAAVKVAAEERQKAALGLARQVFDAPLELRDCAAEFPLPKESP